MNAKSNDNPSSKDDTNVNQSSLNDNKNVNPTPSATTKTDDHTILDLLMHLQQDTIKVEEPLWGTGMDEVSKLRLECAAAIDNYTKEAVVKELESLLEHNHQGSVEYDLRTNNYVKDRIAQLKGGIDER